MTMKSFKTNFLFTLKPVSALLILSTLAACDGNSNDVLPSNYDDNGVYTPISGDVIDGPIANGIIELRDHDRVLLTTGKTDARGHYNLSVPNNAKYPLLLSITGGTDLVTEQSLGFSLNSLISAQDITNASDKTVNINTFSSLVVAATDLFPEHPAGTIAQATQNVLQGMSFGLPPNINPLTTPTNENNVAGIIKANQAAIEFIKRLSDQSELSLTKTMHALAEDLSDGRIDGKTASGIEATQLTIELAQQALLLQKQVLEELFVNRLEIRDPQGNVLFNGDDSAAQMNDAIQQNQPAADAEQIIENVAPTEQLSTELTQVKQEISTISADVIVNLEVQQSEIEATIQLPDSAIIEPIEPITDPIVEPIPEPTIAPTEPPIVEPVPEPTIAPTEPPIVEPVPDSEVEPINPPVGALLDCINEKLGNTVGITPTVAQLEAITSLSCASRNISDLTGISNLTNLNYLTLDNNPLADLNALSSLTNLLTLELDSINQLSDISALSSLTSLTTLDLKNNQITDISLLSNLTNLTVLSLDNNQINDINALSGLTSLTTLKLSDNQITDISALSGLTSLVFLQLYGNQISDISALSDLTSLSILELSNNQITDISPLSSLTNLTFLTLFNSQITEVSALSGLTSLEDLDISSNQITDISPIEPLNIETLDTTGNPLNTALGLAPASISGKSVKIVVLSGSGGFASTGTADLVFSNTDQYFLTGDGVNTSDSTGTFVYSPNGNEGTIDIDDSDSGRGNFDLIFTSATLGTYIFHIDQSPSAIQTGSFEIQ